MKGEFKKRVVETSHTPGKNYRSMVNISALEAQYGINNFHGSTPSVNHNGYNRHEQKYSSYQKNVQGYGGGYNSSYNNGYNTIGSSYKPMNQVHSFRTGGYGYGADEFSQTQRYNSPFGDRKDAVFVESCCL
jgi:hypothetical protein